MKSARRRLAYDELLMLQLGVALKRAVLRGTMVAPALRSDDDVDASIRGRLPFKLTEAQDRVVREVALDLSGTVPTNRLVQGDVGSGKTAVALYALLMAVASGHQGALMAPTELLAEQHMLSIDRMLAGSKVRVELLTGSMAEEDAHRVRHRAETGDADVLIGTHALLTERMRFKSLAVAIIDEQHRFGVHQRAGLRTKGSADAEEAIVPGAPPATPHVLVMTATPIPRTLAMTLFGDLDVSTIDELPPGRHAGSRPPLVKHWRRPAAEADAAAPRARIDAGERAFVVVPAIDRATSTAGEGELRQRDRDPHAEARKRRHWRGKRVAALHGRLKTPDPRAHHGAVPAGA